MAAQNVAATSEHSMALLVATFAIGMGDFGRADGENEAEQGIEVEISL